VVHAYMKKGRGKENTDSKSRQDDARHPSSFWLGHYQGVIKLQSLLFLLLFVSSFHLFSFRGGFVWHFVNGEEGRNR